MHRLLICTLVLLCGSALAARTGSFDAGFIASRHVDAHGDTRVKALGPLLEVADSTQGWHLVAFRPFYSAVEDPQGDRELQDFVWPLATQRRLGDEERNRYLLFFSFRHGREEADAKRRYRFWLIPFYFQGRDKEGASYRAVFPLGGSIHEFLGRDEINFVLFPIRSTSRLNDLETSNWLWPLISKTTGDGVHRARVFPFYGRSVREGRYEKRFVLWPFWTSARYDHEGHAGGGFILFPLTGHMKLEDQETWWVLPPFFRFTKGEKMNLTYAPWPFFQKSSGEVEKFYLWPLYGHKKVGNLERTFVLWPIVWNERVRRADELQHRFMFIPFFLSETQGPEPGPDGAPCPPRVRAHKVWPLYSYRRVGSDSRTRVLELWPFGESPSVERNWAPLWTLYSRVRHEGNRDTELLWGLYRNQKRADGGRYLSVFPFFDWRREGGGEGGSWSILKGLVGGRRSGSQQAVRLLYFMDFGDDEETAP